MNIKRHHVLYGFLAVSLILALLFLFAPRSENLSFTASTTPENTAKQDSSQSNFQYEVVTTQALQERGLGGRASIPENYGMLFVFPMPDRVGFWMKDMLTSIDIIWVSEDGTILGIEDSVSPDTYPEILHAPVPVRFVLETRAGEARRKGWSVGTKIELPLPYGG